MTTGIAGANIWTTGEAIYEPSLEVANAGGLTAEITPLLFAGDLTGGTANLTIEFTLDAVQPNQGQLDLVITPVLFAGDLTGGAAELEIVPTLDAQGQSYEPYTPEINGMFNVVPMFLDAGGYFWKTGTLDVEITPSIFAGDLTGGAADMLIIPELSAGGPRTDAHLSIWLPGLGLLTSAYDNDILDSVEVTTLATNELLLVIYDTVQAASATATTGIFLQATVDDDLVVRSMLSMPYFAQILDSVEAGSSVSSTVYKLVQILDEVQAEGEYDSVGVQLLVSLASAVTLTDLSDQVLNLTLEESVELLSAHSALLQTNLDALVELHAASTVDQVATFILTVEDETSLEDELSMQAWLQATVEDGVEVYAQFKAGDDVYEGWVVNTELAAFSEYKNYPFNSMASVDGIHFGLAEDGLYRLDGDDDAGQPIEALIRTGLSDLGTHFIKDAKAAHIGYNSTGELLLRVTTTAKGQKEQWWYQLKQGSADAVRDGRFTIGRGLRAKYWQFELVNLEGADFEVDSFEVMYNVLSRRVR